MLQGKVAKNALAICIIGMLFVTVAVPIVNTHNIHTDSISKTRNISQISGNGNTLYVGGTGPNNYTRIQDAINASKNGDTIRVYPGCYYENLVIKKSIQLCGSGWENTIIDGSSEGHVISIYYDDVTITNFTIKNCGEISSVIRVDGCTNVTISNNFITSIEKYTAIDVHPSDITCSNGIRIYGNIIQNMTRGIVFSYCCHSHIENNLIENTVYGIFLGGYKMNNNTVSKNTIRNCSDGIFVYFYENERNVIIQNKFLNCGCGIGLEGDSNIIKWNEFMGNEYGIYVYLGKYNIIHFNNFIKNSKNAYVKRWIGNLPINWWCRNYWDDHNSFLPKIIPGCLRYGYSGQIPWINVDWHPATEPYEW
jgi:parallel beta-helix repeat protein